MAHYSDFVQLQYILLAFSFAFGPFKSLQQNFSLFQNGSNLKISVLVMAKVEKVNIAYT
jgi:hypothetical protein